METDGEAPAVSITTCSLPEAEAYVALLVITYLIDQKQYQEVQLSLACLGAAVSHDWEPASSPGTVGTGRKYTESDVDVRYSSVDLLP